MKRQLNFATMKTYRKDLAIAQEQWDEDSKTIELWHRRQCLTLFHDDRNCNRIAQTENQMAHFLN